MEQMMFEFMLDHKAKGLDAIDRDLIIKAQAGSRDAMGEMLQRHKGLVFAFVKTLRIKEHDLEAVTNYGLEGLWEAVTRFKVDAGNSFATYAMWWVRQRIIRDHFWQRAHRRGVSEVSLYGFGEGVGEDSILETPIATESEAEQERRQAERDHAFEALLTDAKLDSRSKLVMNMKRSGCSLSEIGCTLQVSRERARQILLRAVGKAQFVAAVWRRNGVDCLA